MQSWVYTPEASLQADMAPLVRSSTRFEIPALCRHQCCVLWGPINWERGAQAGDTRIHHELRSRSECWGLKVFYPFKKLQMEEAASCGGQTFFPELQACVSSALFPGHLHWVYQRQLNPNKAPIKPISPTPPGTASSPHISYHYFPFLPRCFQNELSSTSNIVLPCLKFVHGFLCIQVWTINFTNLLP